jgi:protein-serine/threonine kinase
MTDLLPPSPSAVSYAHRPFAPSSSLLSSSVTLAHVGQEPSTDNAPFFNSPYPPDFIPQGPDHSSPGQGPPYAFSHSRNASLSFNSNTSNASLGPRLHPLDFSQVMLSHEGTHTELARTVDDLSKWLTIVEAGLAGLLD